MLDSKVNLKFGNNTQNVTFNNPCSGILQKSHPKSVFIRFDKESEMEQWLFGREGKCAIIKRTDPQYDRRKNDFEVTVLQVMLFGNTSYLCEIIENTFLTEE